LHVAAFELFPSASWIPVFARWRARVAAGLVFPLASFVCTSAKARVVSLAHNWTDLVVSPVDADAGSGTSLR